MTCNRLNVIHFKITEVAPRPKTTTSETRRDQQRPPEPAKRSAETDKVRQRSSKENGSHASKMVEDNERTLALMNETGYEIQVPLFMEEGTRVKVDTRDGSYSGRVTE